MKLLELYSLASGLKIAKQYVTELFYPIPFSRYITLHASSGAGAKNYPFYAQVVEVIKPYLDANDIKVVQLCAKDEPRIPNCYHAQTSFRQGFNVLSNSMCHLGNDSIWCHRAGHIGIPLVELFGPTTVENHSPYEYNRDKTVFLTSHRWGRNASFSFAENPPSIGLIDPFDVARAVLKVLNIPHNITQQTLFIGSAYNATILDWVPNVAVAPNFNPDLPLAARMDLHHDDSILANTLQTGRKINIVTKKPINLNVLAHFKDSILSYNHEVDDDTPLDYVKNVRKIIKSTTFFTRSTDLDVLSRFRFKFFDVAAIQQIPHRNKQDFERESAQYLNKPAEEVKKELDYDLKSGKIVFKVNKFVLSKGKIYLSQAHEKADIPMEGNRQEGTVIDDELFWRDINHFMIYR